LESLGDFPGIATLFAQPAASSPPRIDLSHEFVPGEVVARFWPDLSDDEVKDVAQAAGAQQVERLSPLGLFLLHGPKDVQALEQVMENLWETETAVSIGANYLGGLTFVPDDPHHVNGNQWYHEAPSDIDLDVRGAWDVTRGSSDVVVAVVDTGIKVGHPEFAGRLYVNPGEIPGNLIDDDGNCYVDDVSGWNAVGDDGNVDDTTVGHGTWVASILMANTDNGHQIAGFDHHVRLLPIKALEAPHGPESDFVAALDYLILNPGIARIVNMSVAGYREFTTVRNALTAVSQSSILIGGAGNDGMAGGADDGYPESHPAVITIAGTDQTDARASFSDTGNRVDFAAPAVDIYTASWEEPDDPLAAHMGPGTSFSTPMVSGIATLALSIWPEMTRPDLVAALRASAVDLGEPGRDPEFGWGRVNARDALLALPVIFRAGFETGDATEWTSVSP
jgi:subtilisin family serine protease